MSEAQRDIQSSNEVNLPIDWDTSEDHSSSYVPSDFENLKTQYNFIQTDKISKFLRSYPFLIADLGKVYEIKCRYFDKSPMLLHYISETESLESATLAAYVETDISEEKAKDIFSLFDKEWNVSISKEAKKLLMVDMI
jgi:hypothetical protein